MKVIFLGTNGWYDTPTGNTISVLLDAPEAYVILDAGNGLYKANRYIKRAKPIYLFISHFHLDHVIGLHVLAKFRWPQGLNICVNSKERKLLSAITDRQFTVPLNKLPFQVKVIDFDRPGRLLPFLEKDKKLKHPVPCFGFRFNFNGTKVAYVADTGPCQNAVSLARKVDLLIAECAFKPGQVVDQWPHLDPLEAAKIAKTARAKRLILAHFDAEVYQTLAERQTAEKQARRIFSKTRVAEDNLEVTI